MQRYADYYQHIRVTPGTGGLCKKIHVHKNIYSQSFSSGFLLCVAVIDGLNIKQATAVSLPATKGCFQQYHLLTHYSHHTHPSAYHAIRRAEEGDFGGLASNFCVLSQLSLDNASSLIWSSTYRIKMISCGFEIWKKKTTNNYLVLIMLYLNYLFNQIILSSSSPSHPSETLIRFRFFTFPKCECR